VEYRNWPSTRFREKIDNSTTTEENQVINKVKQAKQIVVFGLGRLFWDQYFYGGWDEVLCAVAYSDNNPALWNTDICGVPCVEPGKISEIDGVLVVLFVKEYGEIEEQLEKLGIRNVIPIMDIYDCLGKK
jgi:hypothetical protein